MENNARTVLSLLPEQREDKKGENRIKTEDDKGKERMERRGVTTLAETFRDFSVGRAIKNARKTTLRYKPRGMFLIFSFLLLLFLIYLPLSLSFFLSSLLLFLLFVSLLSCKCNNNKWKEAAFTMPLITFYLS